jgi:predicted DsbA family dithiol-disulfide isomerase
VGQKRLQSAIAAYEALCFTDEANRSSSKAVSQHKVTVEWKPYIIDPNIDPGGEGFESYNIRRWGSSSWTHHLKQEGRKSGANFANWKWWPNTMKAHCLVKFASERYDVDTSKSNEEIFHSLYEKGENISLIDCLVNIGVENLNLPIEAELRAYLESGEGEKEVREEMQRGRRKYQISGVPFFVIESGNENSRSTPYGLSGAQRKEAFLEVFKEIAKEDEQQE